MYLNSSRLWVRPRIHFSSDYIFFLPIDCSNPIRECPAACKNWQLYLGNSFQVLICIEFFRGIWSSPNFSLFMFYASYLLLGTMDSCYRLQQSFGKSAVRGVQYLKPVQGYEYLNGFLHHPMPSEFSPFSSKFDFLRCCYDISDMHLMGFKE